jgi:CO/xanthine dehydrogenase FAD-binding subunit
VDTICYAPKTLGELRRALARMTPDSRILGGGSDLIIRLRNGACAPDALLYTGDARELHAILKDDDAVTIGAAATMDEIVAAKLGENLGAIADAAVDMGSVQIRNSATIGGNIASASPAGDLIPVLFLLDADIEVASPDGLFRKPIDQVVVGPGKTSLAHNECITRIIVPVPRLKGFRSAFVKLGFRKAVTISRIGLAVGLVLDDHGAATFAKVVAGAISPRPVRVPKAEEALLGNRLTADVKVRVGAALSELIQEITPKEFDRDYKVGAARGVAEDVLDRFTSRPSRPATR